MPFPWTKTLVNNPLAPQIGAVAAQLLDQMAALSARELTPERVKAYVECHPKLGALGFQRFCERHVRINETVTLPTGEKKSRDIALDMFEAQLTVTPDLCKGTWLVLLKGRQLGLTWLVVAFVAWLITYRKNLVVVVVNQQLEYAEEFISRVCYVLDRLPVWMQKEPTTRNKKSLEWAKDGQRIKIRAIVGGEKAGRSLNVDLAILDEASRIPDLAKTMQALQPCVESVNGQIVALSSSAGPQGYFYESWKGAFGDDGEAIRADGKGPNGFKPIFLHWSQRRGRDAAWYAREAERLNAISPVALKQEHPETPQEAWEYASGRIYPLFRRETCVGEIARLPLNALRYRAIDWGSAESPFVCLWIAHVPGRSGFLVSNKCPNTIREFFAYRWDDEIAQDKDQKPLKRDDHTCDAVRYAVTSFNLTGLVWVYREFYEVNSVAKGWNIMNEIEQLHRLSGWEEAPEEIRSRWWQGDAGENYEMSVADRSWAKAISTYNVNDFPLRGHKVISRKQDKKELTDRPLIETLEGIRQVAALIDGSIDIEKILPVTRERLAMRVLAQKGNFTTGLEDRSLAHVARRLLSNQHRKER